MYDLNIGPDRSVFGSSLHLDRTDRSKQLRWTEPIGPGDTDGPDRTNSIGSIRLGLKSVGPGRYRSGPDRGCPYLVPHLFLLRQVTSSFGPRVFPGFVFFFCSICAVTTILQLCAFYHRIWEAEG